MSAEVADKIGDGGGPSAAKREFQLQLDMKPEAAETENWDSDGVLVVVQSVGRKIGASEYSCTYGEQNIKQVC